MSQRHNFSVSPEVEYALTQGNAVVALESTIITHGMPAPHNIETAMEVEAIIREKGAIPATIAIIDGVVKVGLSSDEIAALGAAPSGAILKLSTKDLPFAVATGKTGSTTVAATMAVAARAGIALFVTGGIGGVHRGAVETFDISADLLELSRTDVAVISAGVKSLLDIPKTLEMLETLSVPVVGYGTDTFPAFYNAGSGCSVHHRLDTPEAVAKFLHAKKDLSIGGGVLIANPIPAQDAIPNAVIEEAITAAEKVITEKGIRGKEVTPVMLAAIAKHTEGLSLQANRSLIHNNAKVGAAIAIAHARNRSATASR